MTRILIAAINTALIIVMPLTVASFFGPDRWTSSPQGVFFSKLQYILFDVVTLWLILRGSKFEQYRLLIVSITLALATLLILSGTISARLDFLYVTSWIAVLFLSVHCDRAAKREPRDHEVCL